jgi:hypothetical protein
LHPPQFAYVMLATVLIRMLNEANEGLCMLLSDVQSVLSDVYSVDKVSNGGKIDSSAIAALIRKACNRRVRTSSQ